MVHYENLRFNISKLKDLLDIVQLNHHKGKDIMVWISELVLESGIFWKPCLSILPSLGLVCVTVSMCVSVCVCVCLHAHAFFSEYVPYLTSISIWLIPRFFSGANHNLTKFHCNNFSFLNINIYGY